MTRRAGSGDAPESEGDAEEPVLDEDAPVVDWSRWPS